MENLDTLLNELQESVTTTKVKLEAKNKNFLQRSYNEDASSIRSSIESDYSRHSDRMSNKNTSVLSSNLSELDNLLEELSTAHSYNSETTSRYSSQKSSPRIAQSLETHNDDLEDLMSSLATLNTQSSGSKNVKNDFTPNNRIENQSTYDNVTTINKDISLEPEEDSLNAMMASLNSDLTSQGVQLTTKGSCAACGKMIVGQVITALGRIWHPEHFACAKCKVEIGGGTFYERDSMPYCEKDYHLLFSPKCAQCGQAILDRCVTALDKTWHMDHFCCYTCGKTLAEEAFHEKEGRVFCQRDYLQHFAPKCGMCFEAISEDFLTALNQQWHPQCFVCFECHVTLGSCSFFEFEGLPYCNLHFHAKKGSLCAYCQQPISGRCITAMSKKFHPDHFKCAYCQKTLWKGTFKEHEGQPYCHQCFSNIFS